MRALFARLLPCLFSVACGVMANGAMAQEVFETIDLSPIPAEGLEHLTLDADLIEAALAQAPPPPKDGFAAIGAPVLLGKDYLGRFHARSSGQGWCNPEAGEDCITAPERVFAARSEGKNGWCNPPFLNLAIQSAVEFGDSNRTLSLAHSQADKDNWKISKTPETVTLFYRSVTMAQLCEGAYIAVVDQFWEGFDLPLKRYVLHLGDPQTDLYPYPECYVDGRWRRACQQEVMNPYGGKDMPVSFAQIKALFANPPPARPAPRPAAATAEVEGAGKAESFVPYYEDLEPGEGRRGFVHHGWNEARIELGCATGNFGAMKGHAYGMVSAPVSQFKRGGGDQAYAKPSAFPGNARINMKFSSGGGVGTPFVKPVAFGGYDDGRGPRFGLVLDLGDPILRRSLNSALNQLEGTVTSFYIGLFPITGDAIFGYAIKGREAEQRDIRSELVRLLETC